MSTCVRYSLLLLYSLYDVKYVKAWVIKIILIIFKIRNTQPPMRCFERPMYCFQSYILTSYVLTTIEKETVRLIESISVIRRKSERKNRADIDRKKNGKSNNKNESDSSSKKDRDRRAVLYRHEF